MAYKFSDETSNFFESARGFAGQEGVQQAALATLVMSAIGLLLGRAKTGAAIRDAIDDFVTGQAGPVIGAALAPLGTLFGGNGVQFAGMIGLSTGAFSGVGNAIAELILPKTTVADDATVDTNMLVRSAVLMAAAGVVIVMSLPIIKGIVAQVVEGRDMSAVESAGAMGALLKTAIGYIIAGFIYCIYVRLVVADTNEDGVCTEEEYDAYFVSNSVAAVFSPVNSVAKLFVALILPFGRVESEPSE